MQPVYSVRRSNARLDRERTAAAATAGGVRVVESEPRTHNRIHVIHLYAVKILAREHINENPKTVMVEYLVALPRRIFDLHRVGKPATATRHNANAQPGFRPGVFPLHKF